MPLLTPPPQRGHLLVEGRRERGSERETRTNREKETDKSWPS